MMWLKLLVIALIITGFLVAAMWMRLVLSKGAGFAGQSCHPEENDTANNPDCDHCKVKEIVNCEEKPERAGQAVY